MTGNSEKSSPSQLRPAEKPPEWMRGLPSDGLTEYLATVEPELISAWAEYHTAFPYEPRVEGGQRIDPCQDDKAFLYLLMSASHFNSISSNEPIEKWHEYASTYPEKPLNAEKFDDPDNAWVKVRAHYLQHAFVKLLQMIKAPPAMIEDLNSILELHRPRSAKVRGLAQRELMTDPAASARAVARRLSPRKNKSGEDRPIDHAQISKDLKAGHIVRPSADYAPTPEAGNNEAPRRRHHADKRPDTP